MAPLIDYNSLKSADVEAPLVEKPFSLKAEVKATPRVKLLAGGLVLALAAVAGYAAGSAAAPSAATALAVEDIVHAPSFSSAQTKKAFGVNFGTGLMKTPPTTSAAMDKYAEAAAKYKIPRLKIWQVGAQRDLALDAIKKAYGSDPLQVMVLVPNSDVAACATDPSYAPQLVSDMKNKYPFVNSVTVGSECDDPAQCADTVFKQLPKACANMKTAIAAAGSAIQVTSAMSNNIFQARNGDFSDEILSTAAVGTTTKAAIVVRMMPHIDFFSFNPYPIFDYYDFTQQQWHDWVEGKSSAYPPVASMLESQIMHARHALMDPTCSDPTCAKKPLAITETGWATAGVAPAASPFAFLSEATSLFADRYLTNTVNDLVSGNWDIKYNVILNQVYLFELFDESQKTGPSGMEPHWGLLNEDTSPKGPTGGGFTILN